MRSREERERKRGRRKERESLVELLQTQRKPVRPGLSAIPRIQRASVIPFGFVYFYASGQRIFLLSLKKKERKIKNVRLDCLVKRSRWLHPECCKQITVRTVQSSHQCLGNPIDYGCWSECWSGCWWKVQWWSRRALFWLDPSATVQDLVLRQMVLLVVLPVTKEKEK